ncbi:hypothetical protein CRUP_033824 [Coryphaenoides rupestris]|nr:hypothetical protein CRUP_033824 [Coryphaenoides rupestris]
MSPSDGQVDFEEFMTILGPKLLSSETREGFLGSTIDTIFWQENRIRSGALFISDQSTEEPSWSKGRQHNRNLQPAKAGDAERVFIVVTGESSSTARPGREYISSGPWIRNG